MARSYDRKKTKSIYDQVNSGFTTVDRLTDQSKGDLYQYLIDSGEKEYSQFNPTVVNKYGLGEKMDFSSFGLTEKIQSTIHQLEDVFKGLSSESPAVPSIAKLEPMPTTVGGGLDWKQQVSDIQARQDALKKQQTTNMYQQYADARKDETKPTMPSYGYFDSGEPMPTTQGYMDYLTPQATEGGPSPFEKAKASVVSTMGGMDIGTLNALRELVGFVPKLGAKTEEVLTGKEVKPFDPLGGFLEGQIEKIESEVAPYQQTVSELEGADPYIYGAIGQLPQLPYLLAGGGTEVAKNMVLGALGTQAAGGKAREIEKIQQLQGIDTDDPMSAIKRIGSGAVSGGIEAATETRAMDKLYGILGGKLSGNQIIGQMLEEFWGEGLSELLDPYTTKMVIPETELPGFKQQIVSFLEAGGTGALSGLMFTGMGMGLNSAKEAFYNPTQQNINEAITDVENQLRKDMEQQGLELPEAEKPIIKPIPKPGTPPKAPGFGAVDTTIPTADQAFMQQSAEQATTEEYDKRELAKWIEERKQKYPEYTEEEMFGQMLKDFDLQDIMSKAESKSAQTTAEAEKTAPESTQDVKTDDITPMVTDKSNLLKPKVTAHPFEQNDLFDQQMSEANTILEDNLKNLEGTSFEITSDANTNRVIVAPRDNQIQATVLDSKGIPMMDRQFDSYQEFIDNFKTDPLIDGELTYKEAEVVDNKFKPNENTITDLMTPKIEEWANNLPNPNLFDMTQEQWAEMRKQQRPSLTDAYFKGGLASNHYKNDVRKAIAAGIASEEVLAANKELAESIKAEPERLKQVEAEKVRKQKEIARIEAEKEEAEAKRQKEMIDKSQKRLDEAYLIPKSEYVTAKKKADKGLQEYDHEQSVKRAIEAGKEVPAEVMKDYPDLATESQAEVIVEDKKIIRKYEDIMSDIMSLPYNESFNKLSQKEQSKKRAQLQKELYSSRKGLIKDITNEVFNRVPLKKIQDPRLINFAKDSFSEFATNSFELGELSKTTDDAFDEAVSELKGIFANDSVSATTNEIETMVEEFYDVVENIDKIQRTEDIKTSRKMSGIDSATIAMQTKVPQNARKGSITLDGASLFEIFSSALENAAEYGIDPEQLSSEELEYSMYTVLIDKMIFSGEQINIPESMEDLDSLLQGFSMEDAKSFDIYPALRQIDEFISAYYDETVDTWRKVEDMYDDVLTKKIESKKSTDEKQEKISDGVSKVSYTKLSRISQNAIDEAIDKDIHEQDPLGEKEEVEGTVYFDNYEVEYESENVYDEEMDEYNQVIDYSIKEYDIDELLKGLDYEKSNVSSSVYITDGEQVTRISDHKRPAIYDENGNVIKEHMYDNEIIVDNAVEIFKEAKKIKDNISKKAEAKRKQKTSVDKVVEFEKAEPFKIDSPPNEFAIEKVTEKTEQLKDKVLAKEIMDNFMDRTESFGKTIARLNDEIRKQTKASTFKPYDLSPKDGFTKIEKDNVEMRKGDMPFDKLKDYANYIMDNQEAIEKSASKRTMKQLSKYVSPFLRGDIKKAGYVEQAYESMLNNLIYTLGNKDVISVSGFGRANQIDQLKSQITDLLDTMTEDSYQDIVDGIKEKIKTSKQDLEKTKGRIDNPETLKDLELASKYRLLTKEEKRKLEDLRALKKQEKKAEAPKEVETGDVKYGELTEGKNSKTGEIIYEFELESRVPKDQWKAILEKVKQQGGSYWKGKFYFTTDSKTEAQRKFDIVKGDTVDIMPEAKVSKAPEKLRKLADNMQKSIDDKYADRQTNTARRASMAASAQMDGDRLKRTQGIIRQIADALDEGNLKYLSNITARTQIEELDMLMGRAKYEYINVQTEDIADGYSRELTRKDLKSEPVTVDTIDHAKLPRYYKEHAIRAFEEGSKIKGLIQDSRRALTNAKRTDGDLNAKKYSDIIKKLIDKGVIANHSSLKYTYDSYNRLTKLGIETDGDLRAALREYLQFYNTTAVSKDEQIARNIKQRESEFTRQKIEGFFPTPKKIVQQMVDIADIQASDKVLEPSAGVGHIADAIGSDNLDVIEYNNSMAQLLRDKGHNVVGNDALQAEGQYNKIVMNPPFEKGQDIEHVMYAFNNNLLPGGRLVAIMSEGAFTRSDKKATQFQEWLTTQEYVDEKLPDAFKESDRKTSVRTRMITIEKPAENTLKDIKKDNPKSTTKEVVEGATASSTLVRKAEKTNKAKPIEARYNQSALIAELDNGTLDAENLVYQGATVSGYTEYMRMSIAEQIAKRDPKAYEVVINVPDDGTLTIRNTSDALAEIMHSLKIRAKTEALPKVVSKYVKNQRLRAFEYGNDYVMVTDTGHDGLLMTKDEFAQLQKYVDQIQAIQPSTDLSVALEKSDKDFVKAFDNNYSPVNNFVAVEYNGPKYAITTANRTLLFDKKLVDKFNGKFTAYLAEHQPTMLIKDDNDLLIGFVYAIKPSAETSNFTTDGYSVSMKQKAVTKPTNLKWNVTKEDLKVNGTGNKGPKAAVAFVPKLHAIEKGVGKGEVARLSDAAKIINKWISVPVKRKGFRQKALGIYKGSGIIRVKNIKQVDVLMHEVGHFFDDHFDLYNKLTEAQQSELYNAGLPVSRPSYSKKDVIQEGIAEFFGTYLQSKDLARKNFSFSYDMMDQMVYSDKAARGLAKDVNTLMRQYVQQDPVQRLLSNVLMKTPKIKMVTPNEIMHEVYTAMVSSDHPIFRAARDIAGATSKKAYNVITRIRLSATSGIGKTQAAMERGLIDPKTGKFLTKGFYEILDPIRKSKQYEDFVGYAVALRAKELHARNIQTGIDKKYVDATINKFKNNTQFNVTMKQMYKYEDTLLKLARDNDLISKESYEGIKEINRFYVPFNRVIEKVNTGSSRTGKTGSTIKQIKGAELDIINPLESIIRNTYAIYNAIDTNAAYKSFFDLQNEKGAGKYFDRLPQPMKAVEVDGERIADIMKREYGIDLGKEMDNLTLWQPNMYPNKDNVMSILRNGKREFYEIHDKSLLRALTNTSPVQFGVFGHIAGAPARLLRAGATEFSDSFMLRNFLRDTVSASVFSENGFIPVVHSISGIFQQAGKDDLYYKALASGALNNTVSAIDRDYIKKDTRKLYQRDITDKAFGVIKSPIEAMRTLNEGIETSTRLGEFRLAYNKNIQKGMTESEALRDAALDSRDLMDFMRAGYLGRELNKIIPFFNATIQGADKLVRSASSNPLGFALKGGAWITTLSTIMYLMNSDDDRYKRLDQYTKDMYWVFFIGNEAIKVPKPHELGLLFGTTTERMLRYFKDNDPKAFKGYKERTLETLMPELIPHIYQLNQELKSNYSNFYDGPIVPMSAQYKPKYMQYGPSTSEFAKVYGQQFNESPYLVDYAVKNTFGTSGTFVLNGIDAIIKATGNGDQVPDPAKTLLGRTPFIRGLVVNPYTGSVYVEDFYEYTNEVKEKAAEYRELNEDYPSDFKEHYTYVNKMRKYMTELNATAKAIKKADIDGNVKMAQLLDVQRIQDIVATKTLNGEDLTGDEIKTMEQLVNMYEEGDD